MLTSTFKQTVAEALLGAALLGASIAAVTVPAQAQTTGARQYGFSSASQQTLNELLSGMPTDIQRLIVKTMQTLGPQRAEVKLSQLAQFNSMAPGLLRKLGPTMIVPALQLVQPESHQAFINGLFGVSQEEEQFATQVLYKLVSARNAPSTPWEIRYPDPVFPHSQVKAWAEAFGGGSLPSYPQPARQFGISPSGQQAEAKVLSVLPPPIQQLWLNSVQALGAERVEAFLAMQNAKPNDQLRMEAHFISVVLPSVPPQNRQAFMNGVVGVSTAEEQFAAQMVQQNISNNKALSDLAAKIHGINQENGAIWACQLGPNCFVLHGRIY